MQQPRWACPPWYGCKCYGKPVARTTMLKHRRTANKVRQRLGRGKFKWGPKVTDPMLTEYTFRCWDTLDDHASDDEGCGGGQRAVHEGQGDYLDPSLIPRAPIFNGTRNQCDALRGQRWNSTGTSAVNGSDRSVSRSTDDEQYPMRSENLMDDVQLATKDLDEHSEDESPFIGTYSSYEEEDFQGTEIDAEERDHLGDRFRGKEHQNSEFYLRDLENDEDGYLLGDDFGCLFTRPPSSASSGDTNINAPASHYEDDAGDLEELVQWAAAEEKGTSRIPGLMDWIDSQRGWVELFYKHGLEYSVMDDVLKQLQAPCKTWKTVVANICRSSGLSSALRVYSTCPGHMCFATLSGHEEIPSCCECGSSNPSATESASQTVTYIPIIPRIEAIVRDQELCEALYSYLHTQTGEPGLYRDFMDGAAYNRICSDYCGPDNLKWDIFISASTDGFQAYKNQSCDVWPLVAVLLNLPPDRRYSAKNVLPLLFIPGGEQPTHLQSYLIPMINEINSLQAGGVPMLFHDGVERNVRIHLVWFGTDLDALTKIASLTGHNGKTPCRFCLIQGQYFAQARHYYFPCSLSSGPSSSKVISLYNPARLPPRPLDRILQDIANVETARTVAERQELSKESGIKGGSVLFELQSIFPYSSFPPDIMHLFFNIQKHLLSLQTGDWDESFSLSKEQVAVLDTELQAFGDGISAQLGTKPRPLSLFTRWKAAEHKQYTLSYSLVLMDGYLPDEYLSGLSYFADIVDICFRSVLSDEDVSNLGRLCVRFVRHFEARYMRHDPSRLKMSTYVMHLLLHLAEGVMESGPLVCSSQYWVERYIGWLVDRNNARYLPAASMLRSAVFCEAFKVHFHLPFHDNDDVYKSVLGKGGPELLGPRRENRLEEREDGGRRVRGLLAKYFVRKFDGMSVADAKRVANVVNDCVLWSRVRFLCGGETQTVSIASRAGQGRPSHYLAVEMECSESLSDVYYGSLQELIEFDLKEGIVGVVDRFGDCKGKHTVAAIQWARGLSCGAQGQVFVAGRRSQAFNSITGEDVFIIKRLIGVVEHCVPTKRSGGSDRSGRLVQSRRKTYFLDDLSRVDKLLDSSTASADGINRTLRSLARRR